MGPISPSKAKAAKVSSIPEFVFEAVNALLVEQLQGGRVTLTQKEVLKRVLKVAKEQGQPVTEAEVFEKHYLDFEGHYRKAGWSVDYDKPGYNESYEPLFNFKAPSSK